MPLATPVVFPLHLIVDGKCGCGNPDCSRVGKHPLVPWKELKLGDPVPKPAPGQGYGIKTGAPPFGSDVFVVDLDSNDAWQHLEALGECPETYEVETARGWHLYFKHPGFPVKNSVKLLAPGVDVRGEGGFVVGPGSPHRSGQGYRVCHDVEPAPAPAWLLERIRAAPDTVAPTAYPGDVTDPVDLQWRRTLFTRDCLEYPPSVQGQSGDLALWKLVQRGAHDLRLPEKDVLELTREHFDPRCQPPWGGELAERVHHKTRDAKARSTKPAAEPMPIELVATASTAPPVETTRVETDPADFPGEVWGTWDAPLKEPEYLVEGLMPKATVITLFAEGGSLKTWAAISLGLAVAQGNHWLDRYGVKQGPVLYCDWEDGPWEFRRRVRLLAGEIDIPKLGYLYQPQYHLDRADFWSVLRRKAQRMNEPGFVIMDSLSAGISPGKDENAREFSEGIKMAGLFTTATGWTVVAIHHANKQGGMRGSSTIRDQSDVVFGFEAIDDNAQMKRMMMHCDKPGPQKKPFSIPLELTDAGLHMFEPGPDPRIEKVKKQVEKGVWKTEAKLAQAANVEKIFVEELILRGIVVKSQEGRFFMSEKDQ